ncbi:MbtH family NRPS accessory protein [Streptomyces clavifer]|uniref:MbtH family protein n=1 Tax=Streptomyces clavifer TaxID=68188 RepID=UPI002E7FB541|nr:MbtH family NRPS accessory protein [Streptomyces clavifer]WUC31571.1 MbtH family NRPS accessory protein [Streptomyces clavifer]
MSEGVSHKSQDELYFVVRNHEEQYSIWRSDKQVPEGWETQGGPAGKEECLSRIEELWTDMRPASLRAAMAATENGNS